MCVGNKKVAELLINNNAPDAAEGGTSSTVGPALKTFGETVIAGWVGSISKKECKVTYNYNGGSLWKAMYANFTDYNGSSIRDREFLQGFGRASDSSTISLDHYSSLKQIFFQSGKNDDICISSIDIVCGFGMGFGINILRTNIPLVPLKAALEAGNYTPKDQTDADYENENKCVYIYGDSESSKRLRGFEVNADIFLCDSLKCIASIVKLYS